MKTNFIALSLVLLVVSACATPVRQAGGPAGRVSGGTLAPHRVFDSETGRFTDFGRLLTASADADALFLGEFHDDPGTHQLQFAILQGLSRRRTDTLVLAMEMFERDAQPALDAYLRGEISESSFLERSRPWPNYASDYRPLVEFAKAHGWPVVAGNVPRRIASVVARGGLGALDSLPPGDRSLVAAAHSCPRDEYWRRFREVMGDMSSHGMQMTAEQAEAMVWRTYEAQCVKDEAMGEAVAAAIAQHRTLVVHPNGAFHSDFALGTVERTQRRAPSARLIVVSFIPVPNLATVDPQEHRARGDFIVFTQAPPRADSSSAP